MDIIDGMKNYFKNGFYFSYNYMINKKIREIDNDVIRNKFSWNK